MGFRTKEKRQSMVILTTVLAQKDGFCFIYFFLFFVYIKNFDSEHFVLSFDKCEVLQLTIENIIKHLCTWLVLLLLPHIVFSAPISFSLLLYEGLFLTHVIIIFYIHSDLCVPLFFIKRKYLYYFSSIVILYGIFLLLILILSPLRGQYTELLLQSTQQAKMRPNPETISVLVSFFLTIATSGMYGYSIQNAKREKRLKELEKEQIASNLKMLKSQISPHFLFNALNSIYCMSLTKSDDLPQAILTISDMLRYVTYESSKDSVKIQKEINYLNDYITVQKFRISPNSEIQFNAHNENEEAEIAPLILIPFVENAFKHGLNEDGYVSIAIDISVSGNEMTFCAKNKKFISGDKDGDHGIGIQNVQTRLNLLYGSRHSLKITDRNDIYEVFLKIKL